MLEESRLIVSLAPYVESFLSSLFGIEKEIQKKQSDHEIFQKFYHFKRNFVQRRALKKFSHDEIQRFNKEVLEQTLSVFLKKRWRYEDFALQVLDWLNDEERFKEEIETALKYAALKAYQDINEDNTNLLFKSPAKINPDQKLPSLIEIDKDLSYKAKACHVLERDGFTLTDSGLDVQESMDQAHYCIHCHNQEKDSCAKGLPLKNNSSEKDKNDSLKGCPLKQKISEMNLLKSRGFVLGAFATIIIDNPMVAATGHRICNDCMRSCIFQKQEPVNVPGVETEILKSVLALPWGFEIYSLLTRWNPLNFRNFLPQEKTDCTVLVVGAGPAGFTLSHYLLNQGHTVVAIDGLKIEPLAPSLSKDSFDEERVSFKPIKDIEVLFDPLDQRKIGGFGGVAEYGITARWDKNFLPVIRLLLERRSHFALFGGIRFGSTFDIDEAFALGFDHIALCAGTGQPRLISLKNGFAKGVRQASDFLMSLQLTGALKKDTIANLEIRLPAVVIGGGLTALDTATEALAYYSQQVEKFYERYKILSTEQGEEEVRSCWTAEEKALAEEFIRHAKELDVERKLAKKLGRKPQISSLVQKWGGVKIVYRKSLFEAPCYKINREEVWKALEEGVSFHENMTPLSVDVDEFGAAQSLTGIKKDETSFNIPAKTILIAAGSKSNTVLAKEFPFHLQKEGDFFRKTDNETDNSSKEKFFTSFYKEGKAISFFGDLHPSFSGSVVKAMASAKEGALAIEKLLKQQTADSKDAKMLLTALQKGLTAFVVKVQPLAPRIVEVVINAPFAAKNFKPGQFYRLQNFETFAPSYENTILSMEGLAMTGAWVDPAKGHVGLIVLEEGGSSKLCALLKEKEPVVLMGPTGSPTPILKNKTVLLVGGGLGNAVLFSIGKALRQNGSRVVYCAGYKNPEVLFKREDIEQAADRVIWAFEEPLASFSCRSQDYKFRGNLVECLEAYTLGQTGPSDILLKNFDQIIVIGPSKMMGAVQESLKKNLKSYLKEGVEVIASINSPMQCMMKEICAQCLQVHKDPQTGEESVVYSCFNQDQPLRKVDFSMLEARLGQNSLSEKLTAMWVDRCLTALKK